jgi:hypothetical protein
MRKFLSFLSYHNAVPLIGIALFVGASATFAATTGVISLPALTQSTASPVATLAPDVSYLLSADLNSYMPTAQVTGVTEDSSNYYVAYALSTIALSGNAWQQTTENERMTISKVALGAYQDLGLYVASQLQARTAQELSYLKRVQTLAQSDASGTETASAYAGLIGKTLNADSTAIPGYVAVVQNPLPQIASAPALPASVTEPQPSPQPAENAPPATQTDQSTASSTADAATSSADTTGTTTVSDTVSATTTATTTTTSNDNSSTSVPSATTTQISSEQNSSQTSTASSTASETATTTAQ